MNALKVSEALKWRSLTRKPNEVRRLAQYVFGRAYQRECPGQKLQGRTTDKTP